MAKPPWYIVTDNFDKMTGVWTFHIRPIFIFYLRIKSWYDTATAFIKVKKPKKL